MKGELLMAEDKKESSVEEEKNIDEIKSSADDEAKSGKNKTPTKSVAVRCIAAVICAAILGSTVSGGIGKYADAIRPAESGETGESEEADDMASDDTFVDFDAPVDESDVPADAEADADALTDSGEETGDAADETAVRTEDKNEKKEENKFPSTKAEILKEYTRVMNQAKKDKPAFKFYEWQTLPSDSKSRIIPVGTNVLGTIMDIASAFMKDEQKAKKDPYVIGKNSDMYQFPVRESDYGCLLTDPNALKSAEFKVLPNGNYQVSIVLKDEVMPEAVTDRHAKTAPSNHGAVVQPLPKQVILDVLNNDFITAITDDIKFSYTYHDCKATVEYNPETSHIVEITQLSHVTISGSGKVTLIRIDVTKQEFINEMHVVDLEY